MKELQQIVNEQINTMITNGSIEKMIATKLNETIKECVNDAMRSYGDFGKTIKAKIEDAINADLNNVTIPEYNTLIAQLVLESYTEAMNEQGKAHMKELLDTHLAPVPKEITAQQLLNEIQKHWENSIREDGGDEIEIEWGESSSAVYMKAKNPCCEWNALKVTFYNHGEPDKDIYHIGYINEDDKTISGCISGATYALGLAGYLYKLYCAGTKITGLSKVYGDSIYFGWD